MPTVDPGLNVSKATGDTAGASLTSVNHFISLAACPVTQHPLSLPSSLSVSSLFADPEHRRTGSQPRQALRHDLPASIRPHEHGARGGVGTLRESAGLRPNFFITALREAPCVSRAEHGRCHEISRLRICAGLVIFSTPPPPTVHPCVFRTAFHSLSFCRLCECLSRGCRRAI